MDVSPKIDVSPIRDWDGERFHQDLIGHIRHHNLESDVKRVMRQLGYQHAADWFRPQDDENHRRLSTANFRTVAHLMLLLEQYGNQPNLNGLIRHNARTVSLRDSIDRLSERMKRTVAAEEIVQRAVDRHLNEAMKKIKEDMGDGVDLVKLIDDPHSQRVHGYISGREISDIGECCQHIRVITSRLDFGVRWNPELGVPERHGRTGDVLCERFKSIRHTFIVPSTPSDTSLGTMPDPLSDNSMDWETRVDKFSEYYRNLTGLDREEWDRRIVFRHTPLPIPAGVVLFGMSEAGYQKFCTSHKELASELNQENQRFTWRTMDDGAFIGVGVSGSSLPNLSMLMNRRSILFACDAFIKYWDALPTGEREGVTPDPRIGLPKGKDEDFRA